MGQRRNAGLEQLERGVVVVIEFRQRRFGQIFFVELGEGEIELFPEFLRGESRLALVLENLVGRFKDRIEIIHQRAGPIENHVANFGHDRNVAGVYAARTLISMAVSKVFTAAICAATRWARGKGFGVSVV